MKTHEPEDLFAYARRTDPGTSHAAARSVDATAMEAIVLTALLEYGPMTTPEIAVATNIPLITVSPRLKPLEKKEKVERFDLKVNPGSGRRIIVWRAL